MHISPARQVVFEIVPATFFPYGKTRSRNVLIDYESRPAASNIKVLKLGFFDVTLRKLMFHVTETGTFLEL